MRTSVVVVALLMWSLFAAFAAGSTQSIAVVETNSDAAMRLRATGSRVASAQADDGSVTMTLLHNNDGESKLLPDADGGFPGIARFAHQWVELGMASDADILLRVSSGDNFLASKEFSAGLARDGQPLYDSLALRGLYETMGLGNHDFDFGPDITARFIEGFQITQGSTPTPFLAANIDVSAEPALQALVDSGWLAPSTIITDPSSGMTVGVIGALTPRLPSISSPRNVIVDPNVAEAVNAEAAALIEQGIDRIVLVSHLQGLTEDRALVPQLEGVDIVVAGGGDELLKNDGDTCQPDDDAFGAYPLLLEDADGNDVPVVTAPGGYRCIGRLEVTFDAEGQITKLDGASIGVATNGEAEAFALSTIEEPLSEALADLASTVVGESDVDLDGRRSSVRTQATNVGELLADALLAVGQQAPDFGAPTAAVAIQNSGGIRNDSIIPAGEITEAQTFDIAPFANFVVVGEVSRERFKDLLEVGVAGLPDAEGAFPQIAGFTMGVDASQPARNVDRDGDCSSQGEPGSRVRSVTLDDGTEIVRDGQVVDGDDIALATIDFLAAGGDCYPLDDLDFIKIGSSYQQALRNFIADDLGGTITEATYPLSGSRTVFVSDESDEVQGASGTQAPTTSPNELAATGVSSWLTLIVALTVAAAGALVFLEAQRVGRLSLNNRIWATRAWIPGAVVSSPSDLSDSSEPEQSS